MPDKIMVGNVEIIAVLDMIPPPREPQAMFPTTSAQDWSEYGDALENGQLQLYYGVWVVRSQGQTILVDTGLGPGPHPDRGNVEGKLFDRLRDVLIPADRRNNTNVGPSDEVNIVLHTHLHGDHVGWNLRYSGGMPAPYFRRARYLVPKLDWDYFTSPEILPTAPHVERQVMPLRRLRKMDLIEGEHHVTDEVTTLPTPGHTPGHMAIMINSQGERAIIVGDVLHNKAQVQEPSWCAGVDVDKEASTRSREDILDRAERDGAIVAAGHFHPNDNLGRVIRLEGKRYWQGL
ncbi:MAG: MBL fold metallo-hydrolase [Chloroflexi bacterium]|nr:MBL fold metallo-hydrolase [Chloroflexota bacterium]MCI0779882.1 MBL fold metallo-hydrolase [Chloroflexota bacterium]MCI0787560.1 MBL fold metallo-hydrolase [Chloroflexota bacterium]MCI0793918.1 MBL fold metallo-hydrolase [Chloroflexota bacterium]MCI0799015.1 MBL fold metallo-hydrolase [Chloroflexota bacterium]